MDPVAIPLAAATAFLAERFAATDVGLIAQQGLWSRAYRFRSVGRDLVARFSPKREFFDKDAFAARYASPSLPIPQVLSIEDALGGFVAVSYHAEGHEIDGIDAAEMRRTLPSFFAALDAVRLIELSGSTGYGIWTDEGRGRHVSWSETLLGGADELRANLHASSEATDAFDIGYARLRDLAPFCPEERHLIHGDLVHHNVLANDGRVTALLDWGSSSIGDFVYDIAWLTFWSDWFPRWKEIDFGAAAVDHYARIGHQVERFAERLRAYEIDVGLGNLHWYTSRGDPVNLERVARKTRLLAQAPLSTF